MSCPLVSGNVYAFDRATGKLQWSGPAAVEHHGLVLSQPSELPVLTFIRTLRSQVQDPVVAQKVQGSVLCLDKRNGRLLFENDDLQQALNSIEAIGNLDDKSVTLQSQGQSAVLTFTDTPAPKEPPYQAGSKNKKASDANAKSPDSNAK